MQIVLRVVLVAAAAAAAAESENLLQNFFHTSY